MKYMKGMKMYSIWIQLKRKKKKNQKMHFPSTLDAFDTSEPLMSKRPKYLNGTDTLFRIFKI